PMAALGVYAALPANTPASSGSLNALAAAGVTVVVQSHDDGAAQRAVTKALHHQQGAGTTYATSSYGGFTVYAPAGGHATAGALTLGHGVVLIASSEAAAHTAIDRAGSTGSSLYGDASFQQAVGTLPAKRFGTVYYNVRSLTDPTGLGASVLKLPFVDTYPAGVGALQWTAMGMRWQMTLPAAHRGLPSASLAGDTTSLAAMAPADATEYVGVANLGVLSHNVTALLASGETTGPMPDLLETIFGVPATAPGAQVPAATFTERPTTATQGSVTATTVLLREPSTQAAESLMASVAAQQHWSRKDATIAGLAASRYYAAPSAAAGTAQVVEAYFNGVMILASTDAGLERVVAVAQGKAASLGQSAAFGQLIAAAPAHTAATLYGSTSAVGAVFAGAGVSSPAASAPPSMTLGSLVWTSGSLQVTYDVILP
ncbi:MAG: DUF3352 domain-containing protein, partial [Ktedonobacterales bacterium]